MTSKSINKRFGVKRLRRRLNSADVPPTHAGMSLTRANWGTGPNRGHGIDAGRDNVDIYDYDFEFFFGFDDYEADNDDWKLYAQCA